MGTGEVSSDGMRHQSSSYQLFPVREWEFNFRDVDDPLLAVDHFVPSAGAFLCADNPFATLREVGATIFPLAQEPLCSK